MPQETPEDTIVKIYDPKRVEAEWIRRWDEENLFHAEVPSDKPSFSIVIPPPNVTGALHVGHALNKTLQDILARWKRMCGFNVLWLPGMDHAGIATQNVVERQLAEKGTDRHALGRDAFIDAVWKWKEKSGGTIQNQLKRLGASCDWDRERFTLDAGLSRAVQEVFERLFKQGLIYRNKRLINLCPHCRTALSDIEVEHEETQGKMYHIKYALVSDPDTFVTVATTRPETLLGDSAVAVHPDDPRFNALIGQKISLPLTHREIPIIADPILVDREKGTGAVKITPGHDFNDEKSGKRHGLAKISLIEWDGKMSATRLSEAQTETDLCEALSGQTMTEARKVVVARLKVLGLLLKTEDHMLALGRCYRCKNIVEPFDSSQWFVKVNDPEHPLAKPALDAVRNRDIRILPQSWEANYFGWMENIEDWCISRQIWWGHQIPVWYCRACDGAFIVKADFDPNSYTVLEGATPIVGESSCTNCGGSDLVQDPDVLDTWFSSALWPFSTFGWPVALQSDDAAKIEAEHLLKQFYPTSVLVSGFDILFFWIARMIMMGLHFMKEVPFKQVYIHALVRDSDGQKMSKSKGNVIDPLEIMEKHGTDALRFTLASMASPGRDIKLAEERIEGYRNFCNKLWNAARFIRMNAPEPGREAGASSEAQLTLPQRWIRSRLNDTAQHVDQALNDTRFDEASQALYQFVWHSYCDWFLELSKVDLQNESTKAESYRQLCDTYAQTLQLLHPFMPFITEELWHTFRPDAGFIAVSDYPQSTEQNRDEEAEEAVQTLIVDSILALRNVRGEMNIPPGERLDIHISTQNDEFLAQVTAELPYIERLARVNAVALGTLLAPPKQSATAKTSFGAIYLPLDETRVRNEITRLKKRQGKATKTADMLRKKLENTRFVANAPEAVVAKNRREQQEALEEEKHFSKEILRFESLLSDETS